MAARHFLNLTTFSGGSKLAMSCPCSYLVGGLEIVYCPYIGNNNPI